MSIRRVVAHFMQPNERDLALNVLTASSTTDAFVVGQASEKDVQWLREQGLVVQPVEEAAEPETPGTGTRVLGLPRPTVFAGRSFDTGKDVDVTKPNPFLLEIRGPLLEEFKQALAKRGVALIRSVRNGFYTAILSIDQVQAIRDLPFVGRLEIYDGAQTTPPPMADVLGPAPVQSGELKMLTLDVVVHVPEDVESLVDWLEDRSVVIAGGAGRKVRIFLPEDSPLLGEIPALRWVERVEPYVPPRIFADCSRALVGIDDATGANRIGFDGAGEIIAIADTGIDATHSDFQGRLKVQIALGRTTADDPHGHGTHVAGTAAGDGASSSGKFRGAAPAAKIVFQSLLDPTGGLGGLPLDLADLFEDAYQHGARIHNNSWGAATASTYTANASEVDVFAQRRQDMLVVFAAGNEGQAANRLHTDPGVVDWLSIGAPATAKNALTVGASRSDRSSGGFATLTWGQVWAGDFPDPPIGTSLVSGDPECLAAFSSRGPSDDRRIKPDIVAPGTDIVSCRSSKAPLRNFWGAHASNAAYAFMGGTSMACPLVAGSAALVRQYYRVERQVETPSAALIKATIVNGARWLSGIDANASNHQANPPPGNFDQGFGRLDMASTVPSASHPDFDLVFLDTLSTGRGAFTQTGQARRFWLRVGAARPLRLCLCYMDYEGRGLQNNLNLFLQDPKGRKRMGNEGLRHSLLIPDGDNNVEVVRIDAPTPGHWLVQIAASNLLKTPQEFALVATGTLESDLVSV